MTLRELVGPPGRPRLLYPVLVGGIEGCRESRLEALAYPVRTLPGRQVPKFLRIQDEDVRLVVGRGPYCEIGIPDMNVSRCHASIARTTSGRVFVIDEGSRNGTCLDGNALRPGVAVEVRGSVGLLKLGTSAPLVFMTETALGKYLAGLREVANRGAPLSNAPGPSAADPIRRTWVGAVARDESMRLILKAMQTIPFGARRYEVTVEGAIVEELDAWHELVAYVERNSSRERGR